MNNQLSSWDARPRLLAYVCLCLCLALLTACGGSTSGTTAGKTTTPPVKQILVFPNVGIQDFDTLDPAQGSDQNSLQAMNMIYSGLVRLDQDLHIVADQASWTISPDRTVYTFHLRPDITFSDGTPITASTYVYTLTRALLPVAQPGEAMLFLGSIAGAADVNSGKTTVLSGVKAVDASTLVITLTGPADYFLQALTNPIAFPLNQKVIQQYGDATWSSHVARNAVGSGPFVVTQWNHNIKMVLVPNPHYYGAHTRLTEVDMIFVADAHTAYQAYQGGQYTFVWNITSSDLLGAHGLSGFVSQSLLQTDALFFNTQMSPFDQLAVRQAFAYAIDKSTLAQSVFNNAVEPAPTIVPTGVPGYQPTLTPLSFDRTKAVSALQSAYPDTSQMPTVTFSYPNSLVSPPMAAALQQMWQVALGIPIKLQAVETNAYNDEVANHQIQFGFAEWSADFPDPYDALALNLLSSASANGGKWANNQFDHLVQQAEQATGNARLALYGQAEQVAINDVGWLPLDHQALAAVIPAHLHGVSLNHMGLFFGDWSKVYLSSR